MSNEELNQGELPISIEGDAFYRAGPEIDLLDTPTSEMTPILERLGPAPFKKPGFPVLGFLTTVYEHVTQHMSQDRSAPPAPSGPA